MKHSKTRLFLFIAVAFVLILLPGEARAHVGMKGAGDFWNGALHLILAFEQGIAILALGLVMARIEIATGESPYHYYLLGLIIGLAAGLLIFPPATEFLRPIPLALIGLILIDPAGNLGSGGSKSADSEQTRTKAETSATESKSESFTRDLRLTFPRLAVLMASFGTGMAFGAEIPGEVSRHIFAGGTILGAIILPHYAMEVWERFNRPWFIIAARIIGSWLLAVALMLFGASFR